MRLVNLGGVFTGEGFLRCEGRRPQIEDCGFLPTKAEIAWDSSGVLTYVGNDRGDYAEECIDGAGRLATSAWCDAHTHALFGGSRASEHFQRWQGRTYLEIAASGGGIHSTVRCTEDASDALLRDRLIRRLQQALREGIGTLEVKSGYAASAAQEIRLLRLIREAANAVPTLTVRPTFLALHALPKGRTEAEYTAEMIEALDTICREGLAWAVDSFPEKGFFSLDACLQLSREAQRRGLAVKAHADELTDMDATAAFVDLGAVSADHLLQISERGIAALSHSDTVAVLLPATSFFLGLPYAGARRLIEEGARVALASDFNPGSAPAFGLRLTVTLACAQLKMTAPEILCAVTCNAASAAGLSPREHVLKTGAKGKIALWDLPEADRTNPQTLLEQLLLEGEASPLRVESTQAKRWPG